MHDDTETAPSAAGGSDFGARESSYRPADRESAAWCRVLEGLEPTLAHDLRGPLNTLTLHVELLRRAADAIEQTQPAERVQRSVQALEREVGRLTARVDGLLRLVGAPQEPPFASTLGALLEECDQHLKTAARHRGVELRVEVATDRALRQREVLRRALLLVLFGELQRSAAGDAIVASCRLDRDGVTAVLELTSSAAERGAGRSPFEVAVAETLLRRCGGDISWSGDPNESTLRLRFPVVVDSR